MERKAESKSQVAAHITRGWTSLNWQLPVGQDEAQEARKKGGSSQISNISQHAKEGLTSPEVEVLHDPESAKIYINKSIGENFIATA